MSLDQNLFTLNVVQRPDDRSIVDLVDPKGVAHYTKRRVPANEYKVEVYDPLSEGLLATVEALSATSKHKTIQLHNPDSVVELKFTGTLSFKWGFKWEDHSFEWKREECYMLRKPDPAVLVAVTKEPPGRLQTRAVQILDYNLNRFDIQDRKGLEIVILTALLTFSDQNDAYHPPSEASTPAATPSTPVTTPNAPPVIPPKPAPRLGVDRVAEIHTIRNAQGEGEANEVLVGEECDVSDYARYAARLLDDEAMLLVSIRSVSAAQVPKVLRVVEETKRVRHRSGVAEEEDLHQYVIYESDKPKGPKRINLDAPDPKKDKTKEYVPPASVIVHLSKIDMPELRPKNPAITRRSSSPGPVTPVLSDKERRKAEKKAEKESKKVGKHKKSGKNKDGKGPDSEEDVKGKDKVRDTTPWPVSPPPTNKITKPSLQRSSSFGNLSHRPYPQHPFPSPSQLNNPGLYAYPAPVPPRPRAARPVSMMFPEPAPYNAPSPIASPVGYIPGGYNLPPQPPPNHRTPSGKGPVTALLEKWSKGADRYDV